MARLAVVVGGVWLLVGCSAAELDAFNDGMNCINAYPNNTLAQNECMYRMNAYREQQRTNDLAQWCNSEVLTPLDRSLKWLSRESPAFEKDYQAMFAWVHEVGDHYDYYCDSPETRRSAPQMCDKALLQDGLNEINTLLTRIDPLVTEDQRVQNLVQAYNNECMSLQGAEWMDVGSNAQFFNDVREDLVGWRDAFSYALANW